jgi:hypothetical protein
LTGDFRREDGSKQRPSSQWKKSNNHSLAVRIYNRYRQRTRECGSSVGAADDPRCVRSTQRLRDSVDAIDRRDASSTAASREIAHLVRRIARLEAIRLDRCVDPLPAIRR